MLAADSAATAPIGLRLCGMVEEPPRPPGAGSKASPTSVCIISATSPAILPQVPVRIAKAAGDLGQPVAVGMPGRVRQLQVEHRRHPLGDAEAAVAQRRQRSRRAAELQRQRLAAQPRQPLARARQRRGIARKLQPERHRQRLLHQRARHRKGAAVAAGQRVEALDRHVEIEEQGVDRGAQLERQRGVDHVLAGRAPMHEARRPADCGAPPRWSARSPRQWRYCRWEWRPRPEARCCSAPPCRPRRSRSTAVAGITPTAASARASAASKSSMRCSRARSVIRARIAALA